MTATVLANPKVSEIASDSSQDDILVEIGTDEGIVGVGEVDASPTVIKALIEMPSSHDSSLGLKSILLGQDPLQVEKLWSRMYEGTIAQGRRGIGIMAIGAVDIALWDIAGKYYDQPVWKLLSRRTGTALRGCTSGGACGFMKFPYRSKTSSRPTSTVAMLDRNGRARRGAL